MPYESEWHFATDEKLLAVAGAAGGYGECAWRFDPNWISIRFPGTIGT